MLDSTAPPAPATVASPHRRLAQLSGLVWTLVRTDFKTRYHGTAGGFVWALAKPVSMFLVLWAIFSFVFASQPTYKLDLIVGLFLYEFFGEGTRAGLGSLHAKAFLLSKAKFPAWVLVVTASSNALLSLLVFSATMVAFIAASSGTWPGAVAIAGFAFYQVLFVAVVAGISLATSVLFLRYRDLNQVWDVALQAGFFVAPIVYPLGILPEALHPLLFLWPPTPIIEFSRDVLVDGTLPSVKAHALLAAGSLAILALGVVVYRALSPRAAEYV